MITVKHKFYYDKFIGKESFQPEWLFRVLEEAGITAICVPEHEKMFHAEGVELIHVEVIITGGVIAAFSAEDEVG